MTPPMKPHIFILWLAAATCCWSEDNVIKNLSFSHNKKLLYGIPLATDSEAAREQINQGIHCLLLQYSEKAQFHFNQAINIASDSILAHVGLLMIYPSGSSAYKHHLAVLNKLMDEAMMTPVEEWYVSTFLQYISGDLQGAADAFKHRAERYKRDRMAFYWQALLQHYAAGQGNNRPDQLIDYLKQHPDDAVAHYLLALYSEYSECPSNSALQSAQRAADTFSDIPTTHLLYAHLLHRKGQYEEALISYQKAQEIAMNDLAHVQLSHAVSYRTASLAEASLHWQTGHRIDALKRSLALSKQAAAASEEGEANLLLQWEGRTLPLRLLVLQPTAPAGAAINAATSACNAPSGSPVKLFQDCLVAAIQTRSLAESGRLTTASHTLTKAEHLFSELQRWGRDTITKGGMERTCFHRACNACEGALHRARMALYTDSASIWKPHLDKLLSIPSSRFLPPVLPQINAK